MTFTKFEFYEHICIISLATQPEAPVIHNSRHNKIEVIGSGNPNLVDPLSNPTRIIYQWKARCPGCLNPQPRQPNTVALHRKWAWKLNPYVGAPRCNFSALSWLKATQLDRRDCSSRPPGHLPFHHYRFHFTPCLESKHSHGHMD